MNRSTATLTSKVVNFFHSLNNVAMPAPNFNTQSLKKSVNIYLSRLESLETADITNPRYNRTKKETINELKDYLYRLKRIRDPEYKAYLNQFEEIQRKLH